jgi:hypothetical protein
MQGETGALSVIELSKCSCRVIESQGLKELAWGVRKVKTHLMKN